MTDHFTLDVDPEQLREVAGSLSRMGEHLKEKSRTVKDTPGEIGNDWTGGAATSVKQEMTALGGHMNGFWGDFDTSAQALRSLAKDYEEAQTQLADLNKKWNATETAYEQACERADNQYTETVTAKGPDGKPKYPGGLRHEFESIRSGAKSEAYETRRTDQHNLEYSFGMLKIWLRQQTGTAGQALVDAAPLKVTAEQVAAWKGNGSYPARLDRGPLQSLLLAADLTAKQIAEEQAALREAAEEQVGEDLEELNELLEDEPADPEQVRDLLEQIGENADDEYYTKALVDALGPEGLNDLYDKVGRSMPTYYEVEEVWPGLERFNDAIAAGVSQYGDEDLAGFVDEFMDFEQGPKRWALFTDSDHADGRMNTIATTFYNRVYTQDHSSMSGFDPYLSMFNLAYGDDDMLAQWESRGSAADFADVLSAATPEQREKLVNELMQIGISPQMSQEEWDHKARLYGLTLQELVAREQPDEVELLLKNMYRPHDFMYQEKLLPYIADAINDPKALAFLVYECRTGGMDADVLTDAMQGLDDRIDVDQLVADMIDHQTQTRVGTENLSRDLGYLLGTGDLLGQEIKFDGVMKSLLGSAVGAATKNPLPGAVLGVFTSLYDEIARLEENEENWADGWSEERQHRMLSFTVYTQVNGSPPGFEEWLRDQPAEVREDGDEAVHEFLKHIDHAPAGSDAQELAAELSEIRDWIDEARDEE